MCRFSRLISCCLLFQNSYIPRGLGDVLTFFTGVSSIPPLGFDMQPSLSFDDSSQPNLLYVCLVTSAASLTMAILKPRCCRVFKCTEVLETIESKK